jgi:beta-glucosidase
VPKWLESLTTDEKIKLVMGTGYAPIERGINVPGAAAITTAEFMERGINSIALADGPAGLRLGKTSVIMKSGKIKGAEPAMEMLRYAPSFIKKFLTANPEKNELLYQYGTAFPVGTALAQTWSMELMEEFGRAVGTEMVEYGVTFWLAPGMNIQRNPLCGRNYEYYSEDPLLTGKIAAAATRGVQSFEGCYATIKHYAANNREHKRNHSDSIMSERTMREIYLKGFKIAVKEADAKSVMTSYNLLNGTYTANSHDLCTKLLRCEWGFNGVVMTDWSATGKGMADNGAAIKSGNDLIMPGGKAFFKRLKEDLQAGAVTEEELNLACANVLEAIANSRA